MYEYNLAGQPGCRYSELNHISDYFFLCAGRAHLRPTACFPRYRANYRSYAPHDFNPGRRAYALD